MNFFNIVKAFFDFFYLNKKMTLNKSFFKLYIKILNIFCSWLNKPSPWWNIWSHKNFKDFISFLSISYWYLVHFSFFWIHSCFP